MSKLQRKSAPQTDIADIVFGQFLKRCRDDITRNAVMFALHTMNGKENTLKKEDFSNLLVERAKVLQAWAYKELRK